MKNITQSTLFAALLFTGGAANASTISLTVELNKTNFAPINVTLLPGDTLTLKFRLLDPLQTHASWLGFSRFNFDYTPAIIKTHADALEFYNFSQMPTGAQVYEAPHEKGLHSTTELLMLPVTFYRYSNEVDRNLFNSVSISGVSVSVSAVPENSTWVLMLLGFISLAIASFRLSRKGRAPRNKAFLKAIQSR